MFVITVSKRMAAIAAAVVALVAIGSIVLITSSDGAKKESASAALPDTQNCAQTTPIETAAAPDQTSGTRSGGSIGRRPQAVEESPYYPTLEGAVAATALAERWRYDVSSVVADTKTSGSGAVDLPSDSVQIVATTGPASTEFRRVGEMLYVDARRLGSSGTTWVGLDGPSQSSQVSGRAVRSLVTTLSPNYVLSALHFPLSIDRAADDEFGSRFRVSIVGPASALSPLLDIFGEPTDPSSPVVDVWIDAQGRIARLAYSNDRSSTVFALRDFGQAVDIATPPAVDVGGLTSTSGTFLFGAPLTFPTPSGPTHALAIAPTVELDDGIVRGALHATSATGEEMRYAFLGSASGGKLDLGTVPSGPLAGLQSFTALPYANWLDGQAKGNQTFDVRVREATVVDRRLAAMPFIGSIAQPVIDLLQDTTSVAGRLAPTIGVAKSTVINVDVGALAPGATPLAFTRKVVSFDGTTISTNFFPASGLTAGHTAPLVLLGGALGAPGVTNPYLSRIDGVVPGPASLRPAQSVGDVAYDVITWDPRGSFASGGVAQLDNPFFEGRDVSAIIDFAGTSAPVTMNGTNDPEVGMVGASYGGSIQLAAAGTDPRVDAIVPVAAVNSLVDALQPWDLLDSSATAKVLASLTAPHVRASEQITRGLAEALRNGQLSESTRALLAPNTVTPLLAQLQAPVLFIASTTDPSLPLSESVANAQAIVANPYDSPVKIAWFDGSSSDAAMTATLVDHSKAWMNKYVAGVPIPDDFTPTFQWWDQNGTRHTTPGVVYPFSPGFSSMTPIRGTSVGGTLSIAPTGGPTTSVPLSMSVPATTRIAGAATVTFTYRGTGSAATVFARIIDPATGRPLSPNVGSIPIILDGQQHTVSVALDYAVFTSVGGGALTFELVSAASAFPTPTSGQVSISNLIVEIPTVA